MTKGRRAPEDPWLPPPTSDSFGTGQTPPPAAPHEHVARRSRFALVLGLSSVLVTLLFFPAGIALGVAALILGIRARRVARASGLSRRPATIGVVAGSISLALGLLLAVLVATFWTELRTYEDCISGANTHQARSVCTSQLSHSLDQRFGIG